MPLRFCPRCQQPYSIMRHVGDFVHTCNSGNNALDQESVPVIGDWTDYTGSADVPPAEVMIQGIGNLLTPRARFEGEDFDGADDRGMRESTHRVRQHLEHIENDV